MQAKNFVRCLKEDRVIEAVQRLTASQYLVSRMRSLPEATPLRSFFPAGCAVVPSPRSSVLARGALSPSLQLCEALVQHGFAHEVRGVVKRESPIRKAATSAPGQRPTLTDHVSSMRAETSALESPEAAVIVDDVVTSGTQILAIAGVLRQKWPTTRLLAWAAVRTVTNDKEWRGRMLDPTLGTILLGPNDRALRRP